MCYFMGMMTLTEVMELRLQPNELSTAEVEKLLDVTRMSIHNWRQAGALEPVRYLKRHGNVYALNDVLALAAQRGYEVAL